MKAARNWGRTALVAAVFLANWGLDRVTKDLATALLAGQAPFRSPGDLAVLTYALNDGAFLGLGGDWPELVKVAVLLLLPLALCLAAVAWALVREPSAVRAALIVTIAAGGVGNLADRLFHGFQVVDFLNFGLGPLRTGVLNVADLSVTFGVIALLWWEFRQGRASGNRAP